MLSLLRQINSRGISIIHVTHDVNEALAVARTVSVMHQGSIVQQGYIEEVLQAPVNPFVAHFFGIRNIFNAEVVRSGDELHCVFNGVSIPEKQTGLHFQPGNHLLFIHNQGLQITKESKSGLIVEGRVAEVNRFLDYTEVRIEGGVDFFVNIDPAMDIPKPGTTVKIKIDPLYIGFMKADSQEISAQ